MLNGTHMYILQNYANVKDFNKHLKFNNQLNCDSWNIEKILNSRKLR